MRITRNFEECLEKDSNIIAFTLVGHLMSIVKFLFILFGSAEDRKGV